MHPDGDELRGKPQKWKKKEYGSKTQCACATKQQPRGPCKERQICHRASQVPGRCKAQRKGGTQVDRHPANIGHDPEQPVCKEEPCLIQDAQGKNLLRNARAKRFELLRKGHRLRIKELTNQVAAKVQQCGSGHAHQQKCSTQHDGNALPAGVPYVDVDRNGQGGGHHSMLFGQHGQQIGQQCACVPDHSLGLQPTHKGPACEHGKQGCHEDGSLDQVAHRVNRHGVECKQCHPNLQCSPLRCGKVRLVLHVLRETGAGHQRFEERIHGSHHTQVQGNVDDALLPPASACDLVHPDEAAVRDHARLEVEQAAIATKDGAFREPYVVKQQLVVQSWHIHAQHSQYQNQGEKVGGFAGLGHGRAFGGGPEPRWDGRPNQFSRPKNVSNREKCRRREPLDGARCGGL